MTQSARLRGLAKARPIALLCFERDPHGCHRPLLLGASMPDATVTHLFARRAGEFILPLPDRVTGAPTLAHKYAILNAHHVALYKAETRRCGIGQLFLDNGRPLIKLSGRMRGERKRAALTSAKMGQLLIG